MSDNSSYDDTEIDNHVQREQDYYEIESTTDTTVLTNTTYTTHDSHETFIDYNFIYNDDDDSETIRIYHEIYDLEERFIDSEKKDGQYIIGISAPGFNSSGNIFACGITTKTFYKYSYKHILKYLF